MLRYLSHFSKAYSLPSETEQRINKEKTSKRLIRATIVPLEIAECCLEGLKLIEQYAKKGSSLVISDAGVGAVLCKSALQGAKLSVLINLKLMKDETLKKELQSRIAAIEAEGLILADKIYQDVEERICY